MRARRSCCRSASSGCRRPGQPDLRHDAAADGDRRRHRPRCRPSCSWLGVQVPDEVKGAADRGRRARATRRRSTRPRGPPARRRPAALPGAGDACWPRGWRSSLAARRSWPTAAACAPALRLGALAVMWLPSRAAVTAALRPRAPPSCAILAGRRSLLGGADRPLRALAARAAACPALVTSSPTSSTSRAARTSSSARCWAPTRASARASTGSATSSRRRCRCCCSSGWRRSCYGGARRARRARSFAGAGLVARRGRSASGRLGADVGGVITVGAGDGGRDAAHAARRRHAAAPSRSRSLVPVARARRRWPALDLATGGNGHFTRTVLHARRTRAR